MRRRDMSPRIEDGVRLGFEEQFRGGNPIVKEWEETVMPLRLTRDLFLL